MSWVDWLAAAVAVIEIGSHIIGSHVLHSICKPLIVPALVLKYYQRSRQPSTVFVVALICCWAGDVFLLLDDFYPALFIAGLLSFLVGHILLISSNSSNLKPSLSSTVSKIQVAALSAPAGLAAIGLLSLLYPKLGHLRVPVFIYAAVLASMVVSSALRIGRTTTRSFWLIYAGSTTFMVSDSILAINKFYQPLWMAEVWIMSTYITAVWLIVDGTLAHSTAAVDSRKRQ